MLTRAEKRLIRRYSVLCNTMAGAALMIGLSAFAGLGMVILDEVFLNCTVSHKLAPPLLMCAPTLFYLPLGFYSRYWVFHQLHYSEKWQNLVRHVLANNGITEESDPYYQNTLAEFCLNPNGVAELANIKRSSLKWRGFLLLLWPVFLQLLFYVPHMVDSYNIVQQKKDCAYAAIQKLEAVFAPYSANTRYDDPHDDFYRSGYDYYAYLPETEDAYETHIDIGISNFGEIFEISYHSEVNVDLSKEENMTRIKQSFAQLHEILLKVDLPLASNAQREIYDFSDEFWTAFQDGSYYEKIDLDTDFDDKTHIFYNYYTDPEDQYDPYFPAHVSLYVRTTTPIY